MRLVQTIKGCFLHSQKKKRKKKYRFKHSACAHKIYQHIVKSKLRPRRSNAGDDEQMKGCSNPKQPFMHRVLSCMKRRETGSDLVPRKRTIRLWIRVQLNKRTDNELLIIALSKSAALGCRVQGSVPSRPFEGAGEIEEEGTFYLQESHWFQATAVELNRLLKKWATERLLCARGGGESQRKQRCSLSK